MIIQRQYPHRGLGSFPSGNLRGSYTDVVTQHIHHCYHNGHYLHRDDAFEVTVVSVLIRVEITEVLE